ncbi:MAG: hypothetical protein AAF957_04145 [Planctomycetota bacterium]
MPRTHPHPSLLRATCVALGLAIAGCAAPKTRPVVEVDPVVVSIEIDAGADAEDAVAFPGPEESKSTGGESWTALAAYIEKVQSDRSSTQVRSSPFDKIMGDEGPKQLDPDQGPIDLGLRLAVNFGANEAPYDDAMPTVHAVVPGKPGFSDSVLQFSWRERLGTTYGLHGTAAYTRFQDIAIVEGISDARFAFFVVGVHASF